MYTMDELEEGKSYACKFKVETMLDTFDRPVGLSDTPIKGPGNYEGLGVIKTRDKETRLVELEDTGSRRNFVVSFDDCWDIDDVEWNEPLAE
jgi:hypothetical protein